MSEIPNYHITRIFDAAGVPFVEARQVAGVIRKIAARARENELLVGDEMAQWLETFAGNLDAPPTTKPSIQNGQ